MGKTKYLILACFALLLAVPVSAHAFTVRTDNSVYIPKEETISGNLYSAGSIINIDGNVRGDVICAGQTININGKVDGDVICAGQTININGEVVGSIRAAGNSLVVNGKVGHNVMAAGASIIISKQAVIGWDMLFGSATTDIRGKIVGDLDGAGADILIGGEVGKNIKLKLDSRVGNNRYSNEANQGLKITKEAVINGAITYDGNKDADIDKSAKIKGEVTHNLPVTAKNIKSPHFSIFGNIFCFFAALVVGLVLIGIGRKQLTELSAKMMEKIGLSVGLGAIVLLLGPVAVIILLITIIGIPLALIFFVLWLIAIYLTKIFAAIIIGKMILEKTYQKYKDSQIWSLVIGMIVLTLISIIPVLGWLVSLFVTLWGLGAIVLYLKKS